MRGMYESEDRGWSSCSKRAMTGVWERNFECLIDEETDGEATVLSMGLETGEKWVLVQER